ncbi:hypothetical protein ACROYT_G016048 [Oculina patagonica]
MDEGHFEEHCPLCYMFCSESTNDNGDTYICCSNLCALPFKTGNQKVQFFEELMLRLQLILSTTNAHQTVNMMRHAICIHLSSEKISNKDLQDALFLLVPHKKDSHQFLDDLERDLNEGGRLGRVGITLSDQDKRVILALNEKYISALKQNIEQRFDDCLNVFSCCHVFNPMDLPNRDSPEFKDYGLASMKVLANHYYQDSTCREQETDELLSEWNKFKFNMLKWKSEMPDTSDLQNTPLQWTLQESFE